MLTEDGDDEPAMVGAVAEDVEKGAEHITALAEDRYTGWLEKRSAWRKKWEKRWVCLVGGHIAYSLTDNGPQKGGFDIAAVAPVDYLDLQVTTPENEKWQFRAETNQERDAWVRRFQDSITNTGVTWQQMDCSGPVPSRRSDHTCCAHENMFYLFGGRGGQAHKNETYSFHMETLNWRLFPDMEGPAPRAAHSAVMHVPVAKNPQMYVFGGEDEKQMFDDLWCFNVNEEKWTRVEVTGQAPTARSYHSATIYKNTMYIFGGREQDKNRRRLNDMYVFSFESNAWRAIASDSSPQFPVARRSHSCVTRYNYMVIFGGKGDDEDQKKNLNDIRMFNLETETWSTAEAVGILSPALSGQGAVIDPSNHDHMLVFGGRRQGNILGRESGRVLFQNDRVYMFKFDTHEKGAWYSIRCLKNPPKLRKFCGAVYRGRWFIFGGLEGNSTKHNAVWSLNLRELDPEGASAEVSEPPRGRPPAASSVTERSASPVSFAMGVANERMESNSSNTSNLIQPDSSSDEEEETDPQRRAGSPFGSPSTSPAGAKKNYFLDSDDEEEVPIKDDEPQGRMKDLLS